MVIWQPRDTFPIKPFQDLTAIEARSIPPETNEDDLLASWLLMAHWKHLHYLSNLMHMWLDMAIAKRTGPNSTHS
jgi:hypothetical protein